MANRTANVRLITEIDELEQLSGPWRELAHACACPGALPGWQIAWWHHLAPAGARLRTVTVLEGERMVGLAPFFVNPGRRKDYRLIGAGTTHRISPLALPERVPEVARLVAKTLAEAEPRPDLIAFEGIDLFSPWPTIFCESWPGRLRPRRYTSSVHPGPVVDASGGNFDAWLSGRSRNLRKQLRVARRRADEAGLRTALVTTEEGCEHALRECRRLHLARWQKRGGSALGENAFAMVGEAAHALLPAGGLRVLVLASDERTVAVLLALAAGGDLLLYNYGFDEAYARVSPMHLTILAAIEDAFARGERRIDFGGGHERHKLAFANFDDPVCWGGLVIRSRRYPLTRVRLAREQTRWLLQRVARRFLSPGHRARIKRMLLR
jgi:CelD/BcsL family acetyltransferase involved in cellulose biosynthesis